MTNAGTARLERARSTRARWATALSAAILAAVWLVMLLWGAGPLDRTIYEALYVGRDPALVPIARAITWLGEPTVLIAASVVFFLLMWRRGHLRTGLTLLAVTMLGRGMSEIQKMIVGRPRPELESHLVLVKSQSFPSGHSVSSMVFYLTIALVLAHRGPYRRWAAGAAIMTALLVGTSRVMLGVHWPSDVIGGWSFGLLWVILTLPVAEHLIDRRRRS